MSDIIDLNGATLDGAALESGKTYTNGSMRYVTAHKTQDVTLDGITIITGETHGIYANGAKRLKIVGGTLTSDGVPAKSTHGIFFRNSSGLVVDKLKAISARLAITGLDASDIEITDVDFSGVCEDAVRLVSCTDAAVRRSQMHDFATLDVGPTGTHPDGVQVYSEPGRPCANITLEDNLLFTGAGSIFQGLFIREYDNRPPVDGLFVRRNTVLCRMGNGIVVSGTGELSGNHVAGYVDDVVTKVTVGGSWTGSTSGNAAQAWANRDTGYKAAWAPDGNTIVDAITAEQEAQIVAEWRAKFRPEQIILPEGLSPAVLAFLDERYNLATGSRVTVRR